MPTLNPDDSIRREPLSSLSSFLKKNKPSNAVMIPYARTITGNNIKEVSTILVCPINSTKSIISHYQRKRERSIL
jgi:predicted HAD superfamily phosphohydrolase YqeG